ncbi:MAG: hypothetical protein SGI74_10745 [Oligoflexia bacterium]|nr:hypothetical protein [Oligoflexia bacterium]
MSRKVVIMLIAVVVTFSAIGFMMFDKVAVSISCQDPRLFMDGIYYATVQSRKLTSHNSVTIYKRHQGNKVNLGTIKVSSLKDGYLGEGLKLMFAKNSRSQLQGLLEAQVGGENISASLVCAQR